MILVAGNLSWDKLLQVERLPTPNQDVLIQRSDAFPGGAAANVAATLALLDQKVALLTSVSNDEVGRTLIADISTYGISTKFVHISKAPTAEFLVTMDPQGNRCFFLNPDHAAFQLTTEHIARMNLMPIDDVALVGCSRTVARQLINRIRGKNATIFANIGFWIAGRGITDKDLAYLEFIDCLFANRKEFEILPREMREYLTSTGFLGDSRQLILTAGAEDTVVYTAGKSLYIAPFLLQQVINTLGCGDAFMGGYIAGYLTGLEPEKCCQIGHHCASKIAQIVQERSVSLGFQYKPGGGSSK